MRLVAGVEERFLVPCYASARRDAWIAAYRTLALPLLVRGRERFGAAQAAGEAVRVTAIGRERRIRGLLEPWLDDPLSRLEHGSSRCLWRPADCMRRPAELRVAEVHSWATPRFTRAGWTIVPDSVRWVGELDSIPPAHPSRSLKSDLVAVQRGDFALVQTDSGADWEEFYQGMLRPAAVRKFGEDAWIPSPRAIRAFARAGTLLMLKSAGMRVGAICVVPSGRSLWTPVLAVADTPGGQVSGAGAALYKLTFDWARARGFEAMDMGRTSSRVDDPIARYKRKWGFGPVPNPLAHRLAVWMDPTASALKSAVARSPVLAEGPLGLVAFPEAA